MAIKKPGWLKDATATPKGFVSDKGELLKAVQLTQGYCDEWNGQDAPKAEAVEEAPKPAPKKKATKKKTSKKAAAKKEEVVAEVKESVASKVGKLFKK